MTRLQEAGHKVGKVRAMLTAKGKNGIIIRRQPNFSWITAGGRGFIGLASEAACAAIVVTMDGVYLAANNIESPRLLSEELPESFAEPITLPWEQDGTIDLALRERFGLLADDSELDGWFRQERVRLTEPEIGRYAAAGAATAKILEDVCRGVTPGVSELEIAGEISRGLWALGIEPITLLIAADDRSRRVRHYVPTSGRVEKGAVCSLCARSGGLVVSATRSVAFTKDFAGHYEALLGVEEVAFTATKPGVALGDILAKMVEAYNRIGLPGEWENHHQGGMTGYLAREVRADRACKRAAGLNQAYAWNPSAVGAKCEDTVLLAEEGLRVLTPAGEGWPVVEMGGLLRPAVLYR